MEESPELRPFVDAARRSPLTEKMITKLARPLITSGEVKPTDICVTVAPDKNGRRTAFPMVWGFTGKSSYLFNARMESAGEKPLWKESLERRRCIVPASWYYEWGHLFSPEGKKKYMIQPKGATRIFMAGIYRIEEGIPHFAILTREPGEELRFIHDRMPVVLGPESAAEWIKPSLSAQQVQGITRRSITDMVFEKEAAS